MADKPFVTPFKHVMSVSEDVLSPEGRSCNIFRQGCICHLKGLYTPGVWRINDTKMRNTHLQIFCIKISDSSFCSQSAWWRQFAWLLSSQLPKSCSWQAAASVDRNAEHWLELVCFERSFVMRRRRTRSSSSEPIDGSSWSLQAKSIKTMKTKTVTFQYGHSYILYRKLGLGHSWIFELWQ